jgi:hypothetical protein
MIDFIKRILSRYEFGLRKPVSTKGDFDLWMLDEFYTAPRLKTERLAQIARERCALKEKLAKAIRDKKARQPIYKALRALSVEELKLDGGAVYVGYETLKERLAK